MKFLSYCLNPVFLTLVLVGLGVWRVRRSPRQGQLLLLIASLFLYVCATPGMSDWLARGLESYPVLSPADLERGQAIVVLGAGRVQSAPEYGGRDQLNAWANSRLRYAVVLHRIKPLPILLSGGRVYARERQSEAELLAERLLEDYQISADWLETKSKNTQENALFSAKILLSSGIKRVVIVTQAAHMVRAKNAFESQGLEVLPAPIDFDRSPNDWRRWLPNAQRLFITSQYLHEYIGRFKP